MDSTTGSGDRKKRKHRWYTWKNLIIRHSRVLRLWKIEGDKLLRANIIPSAVKDGEIYPVDYCISAIARLIQQPHGAGSSLWYQKCIIRTL